MSEMLSDRQIFNEWQQYHAIGTPEELTRHKEVFRKVRKDRSFLLTEEEYRQIQKEADENNKSKSMFLGKYLDMKEKLEVYEQTEKEIPALKSRFENIYFYERGNNIYSLVNNVEVLIRTDELCFLLSDYGKLKQAEQEGRILPDCNKCELFGDESCLDCIGRVQLESDNLNENNFQPAVKEGEYCRGEKPLALDSANDWIWIMQA